MAVQLVVLKEPLADEEKWKICRIICMDSFSMAGAKALSNR